jgi:hypothetical protein
VDLIKRLNGLGRRVLNLSPDINAGGCCVFAALVGARLEKIGKEVAIKVGSGNGRSRPLDYYRQQVGSNRPTEWNDVGLYFGHIVVEFFHDDDLYHYDATGMHFADGRTYDGGYPIAEGSLTVAEAAEMAADPGGWNTNFDRDDIPDIERLIDDTFNRIERVDQRTKM